MQQYVEGQRARGPNGEVAVYSGGAWHVQGGAPSIQTRAADPALPDQRRRTHNEANASDLSPAQAAANLEATQLGNREKRNKLAEADAAQRIIPTSNVHGPAYLDTIPANMRGVVAGVVQGRIPLPANALRTPYWQQVLAHATNMDPKFDAVNFNARSAARKDFTSGPDGASLTALETALLHLGQVKKAASNLNNWNSPLINSVRDAYMYATGDGRPADFTNKREAYVGEKQKVFVPTNGTEGDRIAGRNQLPLNAAPATFDAVTGGDATLFRSRLEALQAKYQRAMGTTADITDLLSPEAQRTYADLTGQKSGSIPFGGVYGEAGSGGSPPHTPTIDPDASKLVDTLVNAGAGEAAINAELQHRGLPPLQPGHYDRARKWMTDNPGKPYFGAAVQKPPEGFRQSYAGQALAGVNEGIANTLGAPVDLMTGAMNLVPKGINALANTNIPEIKNPVAGSDWWKHLMGPAIYAPTDDPSKQFTRRVGESVGSSVIPMGKVASLPRYATQLGMGFAGGVGGATAQQAFPNNPLAEMTGEVLGSGGAAGLAHGIARRTAENAARAAIPSVDALKGQASDLYRQAETRGFTASPTHTQDLADNFRQALQDEGHISPTGRISEVHPKVKEAMQLVDDYAGKPMNPTQLQTVRKVVTDAMASPDRSERRMGSILTDTFDQWAQPLAPELPQARDIASRYLNAETLGRARELAGAQAGQFSGSGFENALRTQYRGLDRNVIKGRENFSPELTDAIENVSRGTPASNFFRGLGRLAPTGVVSGGMGSLLPGLSAGYATGSPGTGAAVAGGMATVGMMGRKVAENMGIRNADTAELIARNGGALPRVDVMTPEMKQYFALLQASQEPKYLAQGQQ